jgi:hypothetical protein
LRYCTDAIIDLNGLAKQLPSVKTESMGACLVEEGLSNALVAGKQNDVLALLDEEGVVETTQYFGADNMR